MNNMLPLAMNSLLVRNNDIHHYNTRQNHHLRGSSPTCKTVVNSFTNRSFQIWNAISSQLNINVSLYKFKYNIKLFLLENELMITYCGKESSEGRGMLAIEKGKDHSVGRGYGVGREREGSM